MKSINSDLFKKFEKNIVNTEKVLGGVDVPTHAGLPTDCPVDTGNYCDWTDIDTDCPPAAKG